MNTDYQGRHIYTHDKKGTRKGRPHFRWFDCIKRDKKAEVEEQEWRTISLMYRSVVGRTTEVNRIIGAPLSHESMTRGRHRERSKELLMYPRHHDTTES